MSARLLIVDDHEVVRLGVRTLFAHSSLLKVCGEAQNGSDAIRMVSESTPDVVILDLSMPGMNGFELAAAIRRIAPATRIVFFSFHEIPVAARLAGADAFVSKSSPLQELAITVSRLLEQGRSEEADATRPSREITPTESTERRRQRRTNLSHALRILPFDSSFLQDDCTALNVSENGLYFATSKRNYTPGVNVYVTSDLQPDNLIDQAVKGVVVRIETLEDGKWGVAIQISSPLPSAIH